MKGQQFGCNYEGTTLRVLRISHWKSVKGILSLSPFQSYNNTHRCNNHFHYPKGSHKPYHPHCNVGYQ